MVMSGELLIYRRKEEDIILDLQQYNFKNYDTLLNNERDSLRAMKPAPNWIHIVNRRQPEYYPCAPLS